MASRMDCSSSPKNMEMMAGALRCRQAVVVARPGHGDAQQILVQINSLDHRHQEQKELGVFGGGLPGSSRFTPVSVLMLQLLCLPLPLTRRRAFRAAGRQTHASRPPAS